MKFAYFLPSSQITFRQITERDIVNTVIQIAKIRQKLKILPNFGMKICFFSLFFVTLQPICANYVTARGGERA